MMYVQYKLYNAQNAEKGVGNELSSVANGQKISRNNIEKTFTF